MPCVLSEQTKHYLKTGGFDILGPEGEALIVRHRASSVCARVASGDTADEIVTKLIASASKLQSQQTHEPTK